MVFLVILVSLFFALQGLDLVVEIVVWLFCDLCLFVCARLERRQQALPPIARVGDGGALIQEVRILLLLARH